MLPAKRSLWPKMTGEPRRRQACSVRSISRAMTSKSKCCMGAACRVPLKSSFRASANLRHCRCVDSRQSSMQVVSHLMLIASDEAAL